MSTSIDLECLKEKIRHMSAGAKKGDAIYEALLMWMPLQTDEDWVRLINAKTKSLNQREIAAELCATDNIWKKERFRALLDEMNKDVIERGLIKKALPYVSDDKSGFDSSRMNEVPRSDGNPIKELAEMRLKTKLRKVEDKLHLANIRIKKLETELEKYTGLSELNRAIEKLTKPRK